MGSLDDPTVSSETILRLNASPRNAGFDPTITARTTAPGIVVAFVSVQLGGPESRSASRTGNGRDAVQQILQDAGVVNISGRQKHGQRTFFALQGVTPSSSGVECGAGKTLP